MQNSPLAPNPQPRTPNPLFLSGVILAAGKSTRLGRPKQLLPYHGRPLLQHVIDAALESNLDEVVIVLGASADEIFASIDVGTARAVVNPDFDEGQASSLRVGLQSVSAEAQAAAVLLGDQPEMSAPLIDQVLDAFRADPVPILRPIFDCEGARAPGHPVLVARSIWPELLRLSGDEGVRALLRAQPGRASELLLREAPLPDIDTWEDYEALS